MNFSKQYLIELANQTNFIKDNLEKVLRLAEILKFINNDTILKNKLALKGGTAINLTAVELPRLSVDIDLDFTENFSKDEIEKNKEIIKQRLINFMWQENYSLLINPREHYALISLTFSYENNVGNRDNIKIEINFMDRCHILPLENKKVLSKGIIDRFEILTLNTIELYASKINALISRATPRDLYDVNTMIENDIILDKETLRKCLIFYNMVGGEQDIDNLTFENIEKINFIKFKTQLKPTLSKNDKFDYEKAKVKVIKYLKELIKINEKEKIFINEFRNHNYKPEILFDSISIVNNIKSHPMALWRCKNK